MNTTLHAWDFILLGGMYAVYNILDRLYGQWHGRRESEVLMTKALEAETKLRNEALDRCEREANSREKRGLALNEENLKKFGVVSASTVDKKEDLQS
jgi:hypothetical protein